MKKTALVLSLAVLTFLGVYVYQQRPISGEQQNQATENLKSRKSESKAKNFTTTTVKNKKISLRKKLREAPVLLVFWATWCGVCKRELPILKKFQQIYGDEITVLTVASGESREVLQRYHDKYEINFPILLDTDRKIWNSYPVQGTPTHFLIDGSGKVIHHFPGLANLADLRSMLERVQ